ncbi:MAG: Tyrosine recombinase XerC [Planctomycetota bacterium]
MAAGHLALQYWHLKDGTTNLRTPIERMIKLAGMEQWPKLIQNMRSSRQTELLDSFPVKDVCDWFGNSPAIVAKHYAQSRSEFSELAKSQPTVGFKGSNGEPASEKKGLITDPQESTTTAHHRANPNENQGDSSIVDDACDDCDGSTDGRYWTRTNDLNDVNVAL